MIVAWKLSPAPSAAVVRPTNRSSLFAAAGGCPAPGGTAALEADVLALELQLAHGGGGREPQDRRAELVGRRGFERCAVQPLDDDVSRQTDDPTGHAGGDGDEALIFDLDGFLKDGKI